MEQSDWFWNNKTMASDMNYPTANASVCQQMTWPLTYRDGINLREKTCDIEAYFMCQVACKFLFVICTYFASFLLWLQVDRVEYEKPYDWTNKLVSSD